MQIILTILAFIVIFSLLILIHEAGHFFAAKRAGVKVEEFGFGLPPRLFGIKRGETIYSINWIPFGGFVRMLGEDHTSKEAASSKRSFSNQPLRTQAWIVLAGIVMNLLLAYALLTVGFWAGIEPLVSTQEDFNETIYDGTANIAPGIVVVESNAPYNTVDYNGEDLNIRSFEPGDRILTDGDGNVLRTVEQWQAMVDNVEAGGEAPLVQVGRADGSGGAEYLTKELLDQTEFSPFYLPRLVYREDAESVWGEEWKDGDTLIQIDGNEILTSDDLYSALDGKSNVSIEVYRPGFGLISTLYKLPANHPIVTYVEPGSPAESSGIRMGDQILSINDVEASNAALVTQVTSEANGGVLSYVLEREAETLTMQVTPRAEDGRIGIALSDMLPHYGNLSLYPTYVPSTFLGFDTLQYTWDAPLVAFDELLHLSKATAVMFGDVLKQFLSGQGVPEGVSGPVGIAQMTFVTIQDGFAAMLRFIALLSLSLGVINVLPIPALDGGKFFFILAQAITGRKLNPKYEYLIHAAGFLFLITLILYVTFNDIMDLFN